MISVIIVIKLLEKALLINKIWSKRVPIINFRTIRIRPEAKREMPNIGLLRRRTKIIAKKFRRSKLMMRRDILLR